MPDQSSNKSWETLADILRGRRSRRFGLGMKMDSGPMAYQSRKEGIPLSEKEEALLAFAACGITGYALADLVFDTGQGGTILAGLAGRTIPSGDAIQTTSLIVINPEATYYIKKPSDFSAESIRDLISLSKEKNFVDLYRKCRVKIAEGRTHPPLAPFFNINCNQWSLYDPAASYFLPVEDFTLMYINALLEIFNEHNGMFVVDERSWFRPAGIREFAKSRGGHLDDDIKQEKTITIQQLETLVTEFVTAETGMMIQNLGLMTQAMGLGGFPHWAAHYYGWFEALGFHMTEVTSTEYLGMNWLLKMMARVLNRDFTVPMVTGLEANDQPLLKPFCPPNYKSMEEAVLTVVDMKWGDEGIFRKGASNSSWKDPERISRSVAGVQEATVDAAISYCNYVYKKYGRFPVYQTPLRTLLGFQANHVDTDFYDKFYKPEALTELQRNHFNDWHDD